MCDECHRAAVGPSPQRHAGTAPLPPELSELRARALAAVSDWANAEDWASEWVPEETAASYCAAALREVLAELRHLASLGQAE